MAQRWIIHSRDRTLGPWTGMQVREELRAGRVDPFDMVSQEHGTIKRPLVEVDEIFQSSRVQMGELLKESSIPLQGGGAKVTQVSESLNLPDAAASGSTYDPDPPRPSQFQALAAEARLSSPYNKPGRSTGRKHYIVIDSTGRVMGPMASSEILDLWQRGMLDARSIVQRKDQPRKISIQKFISFYERAAPSGFAFLTHDYGESAGYRYGTKSASQGPMVWFAVIMTIVALGFLGMTLYQKQSISSKPKKAVPALKHRFDLKANEDLVGRIAQSATPQVKANGAPANKLESLPEVIVTPSVSKPNPVAKSKASSRSANPPRRYTPPPRYGSSYSRPKQLPPTPAARSQTPAVASSSSVLRQQASGSSFVSPLASWTDGATVSISGYRFAPAALAACQGKCKVPMSGPKGPITAVFFKQAHGPALSKKAGGATLTGIIRKQPSGEWQLIVSGVR